MTRVEASIPQRRFAMTRTITTLFALFVLLPLSACAHHLAPASAGGYSLQLEDQYGNQLNTYHHRGATYVLGNYNTRYNVRITNHTGARVEAVLTVDGRDAVTGDVGNYKTQRGYVIDPYGSIVIDGFRKSMSSVAAFRFTNPGDSYSSRRGTPQNVGGPPGNLSHSSVTVMVLLLSGCSIGKPL